MEAEKGRVRGEERGGGVVQEDAQGGDRHGAVRKPQGAEVGALRDLANEGVALQGLVEVGGHADAHGGRGGGRGGHADVGGGGDQAVADGGREDSREAREQQVGEDVGLLEGDQVLHDGLRGEGIEDPGDDVGGGHFHGVDEGEGRAGGRTRGSKGAGRGGRGDGGRPEMAKDGKMAGDAGGDEVGQERGERNELGEEVEAAVEQGAAAQLLEESGEGLQHSLAEIGGV